MPMLLHGNVDAVCADRIALQIYAVYGAVSGWLILHTRTIARPPIHGCRLRVYHIRMNQTRTRTPWRRCV